MEDIFTGVGGVHKSKAEFISGGADIFSTVPVEKATRYSRESIYRPTSENPDGPFEFYLPTEGDTYIDPDSFSFDGVHAVYARGRWIWIGKTESRR